MKKTRKKVKILAIIVATLFLIAIGIAASTAIIKSNDEEYLEKERTGKTFVVSKEESNPYKLEKAPDEGVIGVAKKISKGIGAVAVLLGIVLIIIIIRNDKKEWGKQMSKLDED